MNTIENCLNCEFDEGQCCECYILSGNEDRAIEHAIMQGMIPNE